MLSAFMKHYDFSSFLWICVEKRVGLYFSSLLQLLVRKWGKVLMLMLLLVDAFPFVFTSMSIVKKVWFFMWSVESKRKQELGGAFSPLHWKCFANCYKKHQISNITINSYRNCLIWLWRKTEWSFLLKEVT